MKLREEGREGVDCIHLAQNSWRGGGVVVNTVINLRAPEKAGNFLSI
jgi:hypothetical protein